jgi:hypothetical protein
MTASRSVLLFSFPTLFLISLLLSGCADVTLSAFPGETPGITMGPFNPTSGATATSTITAQSQGFSGQLNLSALCCYDAIRDQFIQFGSWQLFGSPSPNGIYVPANGSVTFALNLQAGANFLSEPNMPFGKYMVRVVARKVDGTIANTTQVGTRFLPDAFSEPAPLCRPSVEVLPINSIVKIQIDATEASPRQTSLVIAVYSQDKHDVWRWTIDDFPALLPTESAIVLKNETGSQKVITTTGCTANPANGQDLTVQPGQSGHIKIVQGDDRTIVLQERVCHDPFCLGWHMADVNVFSERSFWSVFGGKRMTFTWLKD